MLGIIIALLLGYWLGKNEKKEQKQIDNKHDDFPWCDGKNYGYVRKGESVEDLR